MYLKQRIKQHIRDNRWQYLLILLIFLSGIVVGSYKVSSLEGGVRSHLLQMIDNYLKGGMEGNLDEPAFFTVLFFIRAKLFWRYGFLVLR